MLLILGTSLAFNGMMFLMMVRVDDPLVPRAMFGVLNTLLFFPVGRDFADRGVSEVAARDCDCRSVYVCDSRVQGDSAEGWRIRVRFEGDLLFLFVFGIGTLLIATPLFKRTL